MFKCGQNVKKKGLEYLFLGYTDYRMTRCLLSDKYGNTHESWVGDVGYSD